MRPTQQQSATQQQYPTPERNRRKDTSATSDEWSFKMSLSFSGKATANQKFLSREQDNPERSYRQGRLTAVDVYPLRAAGNCAGSISRLREFYARYLRQLCFFFFGRDVRYSERTDVLKADTANGKMVDE